MNIAVVIPTYNEKETLPSLLENMFEKIAAGQISKLPIIIKGDVQGSIDAINFSIEKLSTKEVEADVIYKGVGAITESDVVLAGSSKGFILGFNVRAIPQARDMAKREDSIATSKNNQQL